MPFASATKPACAEPTAAQRLEQFKRIQSQVQAIAKKCSPATICIQAGGGSGSGVIVNKEGLVLTAAHVIENAPSIYTAVYPDGRKFKMKTLGMFGPRDAAMCQIIEGSPHPFVEMGHSGEMDIGDWVVALGHPGGFDLARGTPLRVGHLVSKGENLTTDCALIGGDSGGPSFDLEGRVIGIHSTISTRSIAANNDVPIDLFREQWEFMHSGGSIGRGAQGQAAAPTVLGLKLDTTSTGKEIKIVEVVEHSPAEEAGFQVGDVILTFDGVPHSEPGELIQEIRKHKAGDQLKFGIRRGDQELEMTPTLISREEYDRRVNGTETEDKPTEDKPTENESSEKPTEGEASEQKPSTQDKHSRAITPRHQDGMVVPRQQDGLVYCVTAADDDDTDDDDTEEDDKRDDRKSRIQELLRKARENGGRLKLTKEELRKLQRELSQRMDKLGPASGGRPADQWVNNFVAVFAPLTSALSKSTFKVVINGRHVAIATIVTEDGLFVTKLSEVRGRLFELELASQVRIEGEIVYEANDLDLAICRLADDANAPSKYTPIDLSNVSNSPAIGTFCAAIGATSRPASIGAISSNPRPLNSATSAYLGVDVRPKDDYLELVTLKKGGPAEQSGLKPGDLVLAIDGEAVKTKEALVAVVKKHLPDETIRVDIRRGKLESTIEVTLGNSQNAVSMDGNREQGTDGASTKMSKRRWSFREGIQHDCHIHPRSCGGTLVDLDGNLIGINIARAGRIKTYAIPIKHVKQLLDEYLQKKHPKDTAKTTPR